MKFGLLLLALSSPIASRNVDRFFVIVLENADYNDVVENTDMASIAEQGRLLTNMHGVTHPSQPNYIAMVGGNTNYVLTDFNANLDSRNIVDLLNENHRTWTSYQEDYPPKCFTGSTPLYKRKHNPFISFTSISKSPSSCRNIVPASQLKNDILNDNVSDYIFYSPNMNNDGHDTSIEFSGKWLKDFIEPLLDNPVFSNTLFVVTYDESESYMGNNQVYTVLLGKMVEKGSFDDTYYTHYSQLAFLNREWGMQGLDQDRFASPYKLHE